jgi:hypothetical protein
MSRLFPSLTALCAVLATPVLAADYMDSEFRPGYEDDFAYEDPISIEIGTRYWYSMGAHRMSVLGDDYASDDTSHILEVHLRIDDASTDFYATGLVGYSAVISNNYSTPTTVATSHSGTIHYFGGDLGYSMLGSDTFKAGAFIGYQYWNDTPDMGRENFITAAGAGNSQPNDLAYHMIRLGVSGTAAFDMVDITAEAAIIPYAGLIGTYGALEAPTFAAGSEQGSAGSVTGWLYGAAAQVMARFHPTDNWTIGVGARAWYLTGQADVTFDTRETATPANGTHWITQTTQYSNFRYGLLGEISYKF